MKESDGNNGNMNYTCRAVSDSSYKCEVYCAMYPVTKEIKCDVCGKPLKCDGIFEDRFHSSLCLECLADLHRI